jgi:hypothetical protein
MILSLNQYAILNSCCNDLEIFYFLFAGVNYIHTSGEADRPIRVQAIALFPEIVDLVNKKYLTCWKFQQSEKRTKVRHPIADDFALYSNYGCRTYDEHIAEYGYGPHEFQTTSKGLAELERGEYRFYDKLLNYGVDEENVSRRKDEIVEALREASGIELHSETKVSKLLSIPVRSVLSISRSLGIGTNITSVRYFSNDEIGGIWRASQSPDQKEP